MNHPMIAAHSPLMSSLKLKLGKKGEEKKEKGGGKRRGCEINKAPGTDRLWQFLFWVLFRNQKGGEDPGGKREKKGRITAQTPAGKAVQHEHDFAILTYPQNKCFV